MEPDDKFAAVDLSIFREIKMLSGERIRHERNLRGITQLQLATNMGGSPRWLREIEAGAPVT